MPLRALQATIAGLCLAASAQAPHFAAVSLRPADRPGPTSTEASPGRLNISYIAVAGLIHYAYGLHFYDRVNGDALARDPARNDQYILQAVADGPATDAQMRVMLQTFLAERFQLRVHRDTQDETFLALTAFPAGPRNLDPERPLPAHADEYGCRRDRGCQPGTMETLAASLSLVAGGPVRDETGISGAHYYTLWFEEWVARFDGQAAADASGAPSLRAALRDQLGLQLRQDRGPTTLLIVDRVAPPAPDGP